MGPYSYISEGWLLQPSIQLCELEGTLSNCITFLKKKKKKEKKGRGQGWNSLAVQWLGPGASTAVARVQSLVREIRSRKSHDRAKKEKKVFFPRAVATNNHKLNVLNIYFLTFLKARILKSSCFDKAMGSRDEPLLASSGGSWHSLACGCITLCPHHHTVFFPVCLCLPLSVFLLKTSITGFGTTLIQYDLILTNYICKDTISKQSHILRFHVDINLE